MDIEKSLQDEVLYINVAIVVSLFWEPSTFFPSSGPKSGSVGHEIDLALLDPRWSKNCTESQKKVGWRYFERFR